MHLQVSGGSMELAAPSVSEVGWLMLGSPIQVCCLLRLAPFALLFTYLHDD